MIIQLASSIKQNNFISLEEQAIVYQNSFLATMLFKGRMKEFHNYKLKLGYLYLYVRYKKPISIDSLISEQKNR